jgi:hypothetical protein
MLFTSAPVLIGAAAPRAFLETAQRAAGQLAAVLRDPGAESVERRKARLDAATDQVRGAAAPLVATLDPAQLTAAFGSDEMDPSEG